MKIILENTNIYREASYCSQVEVILQSFPWSLFMTLLYPLKTSEKRVLYFGLGFIADAVLSSNLTRTPSSAVTVAIPEEMSGRPTWLWCVINKDYGDVRISLTWECLVDRHGIAKYDFSFLYLIRIVWNYGYNIHIKWLNHQQSLGFLLR